jgi:spore coat protein CotH
MNHHLRPFGLALTATVVVISILAAIAQTPNRRDNESPQRGPQDFVVGPSGPGGPGGPGGPRMMGGPMGQETKLVDRFDKDSNGWLGPGERKAAREFLQEERADGRGPREFGPPGGRRDQNPPQPGKRVSPSDIKSYGEMPFYDPNTVRTLFLEFENGDWEKELSDFRNTDVEVPAKLTVDGKSYKEVGVHFRGMSSLMGVPEGRKRSLNVSLDFVHEDQNLLGYRTLNLLNAHEDPSFLRAILYYEIAREYIPAPKANFVRVVINGEDWGIYQNVQQFNKEFVRENFRTTKGTRWKVRGPNPQGSLVYLGDDPEMYKRVYTIKSKDDPKSWRALINLCKVLTETPPDQLEAALNPILDLDGTLKFLALDNTMINNDGYWIRASDYSLYLDEKGKFHVLPQDANETFARPGGPGFGGPGGMRFFGPAQMLVRGFFDDGDKNQDQKLSAEEMRKVAEVWFAKLDPEGKRKLSAAEFTAEMGKFLSEPMRPPAAPERGVRTDRAEGPRAAVGPALFAVSDQNTDGELTAQELTTTFTKWSTEFDADKDKSLKEEELQKGLGAILPAPNFGPAGPGGGGGRVFAGSRLGPNDPQPGGPNAPGPGGPQMRGMRGPGGNMPRVEGVKLDPFIVAKDNAKPLVSKLLAVPALRERYLSYVREIAGKQLDWKKLGPVAERYHALIAPIVREETRALDSTEAFKKSLTEDIEGRGSFGRIGISLKSFADQRREYLLNYKEEMK